MRSSRSLRSLGRPVLRAFLRMALPSLRKQRSARAAAYLGVSRKKTIGTHRANLSL